MIVGYRDRRTRDFATGKWNRRLLRWIERSARLKLDRLEAAASLKDLAALPGNRFQTPERRPKGPVQHPNQRSVENLLRVAARISGARQRGDRRLSLGGRTWPPYPAIHPGEHLAEELGELGMSAAELARHISVPTNRVHADTEPAARNHGGHGVAARPLLRHHARILAEPPENL